MYGSFVPKHRKKKHQSLVPTEKKVTLSGLLSGLFVTFLAFSATPFYNDQKKKKCVSKKKFKKKIFRRMKEPHEALIEKNIFR